MIGFSPVQIALLLAAYLSFGALLGAMSGLLLTVLLRQPRRTALWDAVIGVWGILGGLVISSWAGMHVEFVNGHGLGIRGLLAERGLVLASCLVVLTVSARHVRLRREGSIVR
jgi:hypothetical protein